MLRRATLISTRHIARAPWATSRPRQSLFPPRIAALVASKSDMAAGQAQQPQPREQTEGKNMGVVPLDDVHAMPHHFHHLSNELLFHLAKNQVHGACRERLIREIMRVDRIDWDTAYQKVEMMNQENDEGAWLVTFPYKVGFSIGLTAAITSMPLVFDLETVIWFNENYVHEDLPEGGVEVLDNIWKVGCFSWGWMEPLMGTASFVLLGFQFARAQMTKLGARPYTEMLLSYRADRLAKRYPQYNRSIVREFSKTDSWAE